MTMEQVIERWQVEEAAVRARLGEVGTAAPSDVAQRSGMEVFDAIFAGELPPPPIGLTLDFVPIHVAPGEAVFQGSPKRRHYNPLGTVHGGWIATLLDSAVACSVHTALPPGKTYTTLELKLNYVRALTEKVTLVRAIAQVIHVGGRTATAEGRLVGPDGKLYAHASTTCLVMDLGG